MNEDITLVEKDGHTLIKNGLWFFWSWETAREEMNTKSGLGIPWSLEAGRFYSFVLRFNLTSVHVGKTLLKSWQGNLLRKKPGCRTPAVWSDLAIQQGSLRKAWLKQAVVLKLSVQRCYLIESSGVPPWPKGWFKKCDLFPDLSRCSIPAF